MKIETIDLDFMDTKQVIASFLLLGDDGASAAIVETGPTTCLDRLRAGLRDHGVSPDDVRQVFLTHIHLDHAGASGHLSELLPNATFYVHEVGYPHLVDPSKLVKSATRIYGESMDELWGEARPVPEDRIVILKEGDETKAAGGVLVAHDTPGHAYHHLAYLEPASGALFSGRRCGHPAAGPILRPPADAAAGDRRGGVGREHQPHKADRPCQPVAHALRELRGRGAAPRRARTAPAGLAALRRGADG